MAAGELERYPFLHRPCPGITGWQFVGSLIMSVDRNEGPRWSWRFGVIEILGVSFSFSALFALFHIFMEGVYYAESQRNVAAGLLASAISLCGAFLSSRLATRFDVRGNAPRLGLQLLCTLLLVPPLLCVSIATLPLLYLSFAIGRRR